MEGEPARAAAARRPISRRAVLRAGLGAGAALAAAGLGARRGIAVGAPDARPAPPAVPPAQAPTAAEPDAVAAPIQPIEEIDSRYYLRLRVPDRAGVLSRICGVLGDRHGISISDIIQKETSLDDRTAEIVIMTHAAREAAMRAALIELEALPVVNAVGNFIRVESPREAAMPSSQADRGETLET